VLARQAAAAVGVIMCWPWETAATLPSARRREALRRPCGRRGAGHIVAAARLQLVNIIIININIIGVGQATQKGATDYCFFSC